MQHELQKADLWKRIGAGILDLILVVVLATGFGAGISSVSGYDKWNNTLDGKYQHYIEKYSLNLEKDPEGFEALPEAEQEAYLARREAAEKEMQQDQEAVKAYHMVSNLMLIIVTCGILLAMLALEFGVPLLFGNGQTVGKKVFSLCVVRNDGVKLNGFQHFTRAVLGKYAVETMIPVYVVIMLMQGQSVGLLLLLVIALLLAQCILVLATRNRCPIHDLMAGTVVVDYGSQKIFKSTEDLIAYQKKIAADRAARQDY